MIDARNSASTDLLSCLEEKATGARSRPIASCVVFAKTFTNSTLAFATAMRSKTSGYPRPHCRGRDSDSKRPAGSTNLLRVTAER